MKKVLLLIKVNLKTLIQIVKLELEKKFKHRAKQQQLGHRQVWQWLSHFKE